MILAGSTSPCRTVLEVTKRFISMRGYGRTRVFLLLYRNSFQNSMALLELMLQMAVVQSISSTQIVEFPSIYWFLMHFKNKEPCRFNLHGDFNFNLVEFIHKRCRCLTGMSLTQKSTACNHGGFDPWIQAPRNHGRESKWLTSTSTQKKLIVQLEEPKWLHTQDDGWYMEQSSLQVLLCAYLLLLGLSRYNTNILTVVECLVQIGFRTWYPEAGEKYVAKCMYCPSFSSFFWVWTQRH